MGAQDLIFAFVNMLHMLWYVHQGAGGRGGVLMFLTSTSFYVTEHVAVVKCCQHVAHAVVYSSGGGGCINVPDEYFIYVTEHVAVVKCCQHVAHAVVYSSGCGGCINVPDEYFIYVTEHVAVVKCCQHGAHAVVYSSRGWGGVLMFLTSCNKDYPHKRFKMAQVNHKKMFLLRLIIFEVVCGANTIEPLLLVFNKWMVHGNTSKNEDQCPCSTRKTSKCTKKNTPLGLTVGHGVIMSPCWSLWLLRCQKHSSTEASRRGKNGWVDVCLG